MRRLARGQTTVSSAVALINVGLCAVSRFGEDALQEALTVGFDDS